MGLNALGQIDFEELIVNGQSFVEFELFDSGEVHKGKMKYTVEPTEDTDIIRISALSNSGDPKASIDISKHYKISPSFLIFLGLYLGDGSKSSKSEGPGLISLSQREPNIALFAREQFKDFFGKTVKFVHHVSEDALYFMDKPYLKQYLEKRISELPNEIRELHNAGKIDEAYNEYEKMLPSATRISIRKYMGKKGLVKFKHLLFDFLLVRKDLKELLIKQKNEELNSLGFKLTDQDSIDANVRLPGVKGAREIGKSSRSDELNVKDVEYFRPLFMRILQSVSESISRNHKDVTLPGRDKPFLSWYSIPSEMSRDKIDLKKYISSKNCKFISRKADRRYKIASEDTATLSLDFGKDKVKVAKHVPISPLFCVGLGLYLAEGCSKKHLIFDYTSQAVGGLRIGFTASEPDSVSMFIKFFEKIFVSTRPDYWRIKIGNKYYPETVAIGNKNLVPMLRRGPKGQGASNSIEITELLKKWMIRTMPLLSEYEKEFDHLEFTGAGIPRIDIFYPNVCKLLFFSLLHDFIIEKEMIENCLG